ncbi:hypothetical protein [Streptomyces ipomoeae]|uniref:hypothetical protein n=1 Tax=Streptomyces ipomoeae TaxID=103232 RepID=UPI001146716E|nr:hypothetical protein [Streptomyces ipomoeae]MDX2937990.1 hypothetical protein [Streptomyces ipomoeae]TQE20782.1 hypothetical protein SipoB123_27840 [Streptomyces ipomoeae]
MDAQGLIDDWESIREGYFPGDGDEALLACVEELQRARDAEPRDADAVAFFTLGLVWMYGHVMFGAEPAAADRAGAALSAVASDPALEHSVCVHETHPCDGDLDELLESFPVLLSLLAGGSEYEWADVAPESHWRCPHNIAGFARSAATAIGHRSSGAAI